MQHDSKDGSNFSSAKHCRLEAILQQCVNTMDTASQQWGKVHASASEMSNKHVKEMDTLVRNAMDGNNQHDAEIDILHLLVDEDTKRNSLDVINHFDAVLEYERVTISGVMEAVEAHASCLQELSEDHNGLASSINFSPTTTFQHDYMVYEPSGETLLRSKPDVPSKGTIESLRTMPSNVLLEEFRENNTYESTKEPKPSLIPRFPLIRLN